jgi:uncharacterized protein (DUF362 family)/Pyruvate/2-oxoacid:ferredoxin oxidoreductase delta subunit
MELGVVSVKSYEREEITEGIDKLLEQIGGIEKYIPKNSKVFIKVNLVRDMPPEKCGTTHPEVVIAVAKQLIKKCNATVIVGDSSGGLYTKAAMHNVYKVAKMDYACKESGAMLNENFLYTNVPIENGIALKKLDVTDSFLDADVVVNISKLKTHSFTGYSGCVKNLYGLIPGLVKVEVHSQYPDLDTFTDVLIDIERFASNKIKLHILDAVIGMEGAGPTNGKPKFMGKLIAGVDPYLVDAAGVSLFEQPLSMPLLKRAKERGLITEEKLNIQPIKSIQKDFIEDFDKIKVFSVSFKKMPRWMAYIVKNMMTPKVTPLKKCKGCQKCKNHCPANAIIMAENKASVNQSKCIRCYCCQELCPYDAIKLKKPLVYQIARMLSKGSTKKAKK